jgi:hypothetical protein
MLFLVLALVGPGSYKFPVPILMAFGVTFARVPATALAFDEPTQQRAEV